MEVIKFLEFILHACVLVVPNNFEPTFTEIWEQDANEEDDVDFVTDNLAEFLETAMKA